jgi:hypothetical protein
VLRQVLQVQLLVLLLLVLEQELQLGQTLV